VRVCVCASQSPLEAKYRKLKETSAAVQAVWSASAPSARALLKAVGFEAVVATAASATASVASGTGFIQLPWGEEPTQRVADALAFFDAHELGYAANGSETSSLGSGSGSGNQSSPVSPRQSSGKTSSSGGSRGPGGGDERVLPPSLEFLRMRPLRAELGECIGEGSFGVVFSGSYRVSKGAPPLPVAFKRIKLPAYGLSAEVVAALTREVQAMQRLNHPNLLRLFCVCDDPQAVDMHGRELGMCLCLENCERGSLRDILKDAAVDLPWKVRSLVLVDVDVSWKMPLGKALRVSLALPRAHLTHF